MHSLGVGTAAVEAEAREPYFTAVSPPSPLLCRPLASQQVGMLTFRRHMLELTGTSSGTVSSEAHILRSRVSSDNAAEPFLLLLPSVEVRLDLRRFEC